MDDDMPDMPDMPEEMKDPNNPNYLMYHINRLMKPGGTVILNGKDGPTVLNADDLKTLNQSSGFSTSSKSRQEKRALARKERKKIK